MAAGSFCATLMFYAGAVGSSSYYAYFHVSYASLGLSFSELALDSLRLITMPVLMGLALVMLVPELPAFLGSLGLPDRWVFRARRLGHLAAARYPWFVVSGVLLMVLWPFIAPLRWTAPLLVASGLLLGQTRAAQRAGRGPVSGRPGGEGGGRRALTVALAGLFVLWAVALSSGRQGEQEARQVEERLVERTSVVVLSTDPLAFSGSPRPGIEDLGRERHYRYRYTGLRLLVERDKRYYLLPLGWRHRTDPTYVIEDDDSIRIELHPGVQLGLAG
ncbi:MULTISPECIES: hypothetical protein [Streptomyces]|uniref:hypothetical protein n=1 Tax=Streptomyces TaxID=1883 RepID=UPI001F619D31|nr:hypothetical protein [Streptomyces griseocarneus]